MTTLTYILRGTEVVQRNNENALVTVHFNTPVVKARLVPAGKDLRLIIEMRADVTPTINVVPTKDNGAMLHIDFAPGSYLPPGTEAPADSTSMLPTGTSDAEATGAAAASTAGSGSPSAAGAAPSPPGVAPGAASAGGSASASSDFGIPAANATFAAEPAKMTAKGNFDLEEPPSARFRWGITAMGGPIVGSLSGVAGGLDLRLGVQLSSLFGLYAQPVAFFGAGSSSRANPERPPRGSRCTASVPSLTSRSSTRSFLAAGPEVLVVNVGSVTATYGGETFASQSVSQTDFAIAGRIRGRDRA